MIVGDSCWVLGGDEKRMFGDGSWALDVWCGGSAHVVRTPRTCGADGKHQWC